MSHPGAVNLDPINEPTEAAKPTESKPAFTADSWARRILQFASHPSGLGRNFHRLKTLLNGTPVSHDAVNDASFVRLIRIPVIRGSTNESLKFDEIEIESAAQLEAVKLPSETERHLVIMRGYPSSQWMKVIGARYTIDPEFFNRHLDLTSPQDKTNTFSHPTLPSASGSLIRLKLTTTGTREVQYGGPQVYRNVELLREENARSMESYLRSIDKLKPRDPIVRDFVTLDEMHFAFEQLVSACVVEVNNSWAVVVWIDSGRSLCGQFKQGSALNELPDTLTNGNSTVHPIMRYRPNMALVPPHKLPGGAFEGSQVPEQMEQSAYRLAFDYGRFSRRAIMGDDAFYALNELFSFAAFSEIQFLNMAESKLERYEDASTQEDTDHVPSLKDLKRVIYRHKHSVEGVLECLENIEHSNWSRSASSNGTESSKEFAKSKKRELIADFQYLERRVNHLHARAQEAIGMLHNAITIAQSKSAIVQSKRIGKLTILAFAFVPLSFTCSFFSMNFRQVGAGSDGLPLWIFFLAATVISLCSVVALVISSTPDRSLKRARRKASTPSFGA